MTSPSLADDQVILAYTVTREGHERGVHCAPPPALEWTCPDCGVIFWSDHVTWSCITNGR